MRCATGDLLSQENDHRNQTWQRIHEDVTTGWGPRSLLRSVGLFLWLNYMVYGRYNYSIHGDYFMVYKPTNITGGAHPVSILSIYV